MEEGIVTGRGQVTSSFWPPIAFSANFGGKREKGKGVGARGMNRQLLDPFEHDYPDRVVEEVATSTPSAALYPT